MKNARGHILLLHQKGSSPLGLQPLNKCYFQKSSLQKEFQSLLDSQECRIFGIQGIVVGDSEFLVCKWVSGKGIAPAGWREMRTLLSIFPNPKVSRKHFSTPKKASFIPPGIIFQPSKKYLSHLKKTSFIPSQKHLPNPQKVSSKVSSNPILSLQKTNYKHPEIHLIPITKNHDSKI